MEVPIIWRNSEREGGIISITHYSVICTSYKRKGEIPQVRPCSPEIPAQWTAAGAPTESRCIGNEYLDDVKEDEHTRFIMNCAMKRYSICGCFLNE